MGQDYFGDFEEDQHHIKVCGGNVAADWLVWLDSSLIYQCCEQVFEP